MPRDSIPLSIEDISNFSRALTQQLMSAEAPPSHLTLMNMLARANGFRNFQHLRAAHQAGERLSEPRMISKPVDHTIVERALNLFDAQGRLTQWSSRRSMQELCLWALWARLPANSVLNDKQITALLDRLHLFEDAALIRRELVDFRLVSRKADGSDYRRTEKPPTPEARALIRHLSSRS